MLIDIFATIGCFFLGLTLVCTIALCCMLRESRKEQPTQPLSLVQMRQKRNNTSGGRG